MTDPAAKAPFLPYDYARCHGRDWPECADCLRRLAPDRPGGWQTYRMPPERRPHPAWRCEYRITQRQRDALFVQAGDVTYYAGWKNHTEQSDRGLELEDPA